MFLKVRDEFADAIEGGIEVLFGHVRIAATLQGKYGVASIAKYNTEKHYRNRLTFDLSATCFPSLVL
jgi:hypothetical protein